MKRELKHDILAEKIWERLPEQDKQLRRVRRSIAQRAADYFAGTGSLAGEPELLNWQALSGKLKLEPQEEDFIEKSWEEVLAQKEEEQRRVEALEEQARREKRLREGAEQAQQEAEQNARQARQRTRLAFGALLLAILLVIGTFWLWQESKRLAGDLEDKSEELSNNLDKLQAQEIELKEALVEARTAKDTAEARRIEAELSEGKAKKQTMIAEAARADLEIYAREAMPVLIEDIDNSILFLDYEAALANCKTAWNLDPENGEVGRRFQEIAYFYTEAGAYDKAEKALAYIGRAPEKGGNRQEALRAAVQKIDFTYWRDTLEARYYPDIVRVEGGSFCMGRDPAVQGPCDSSDTKVILDDFGIGKTEVTVWQYHLYCRGSGQDSLERIQAGLDWELQGDFPIVRVSWYDAARYADWVNQQKGLDTVYNFVHQIDKNDWEVTLNEVKGVFRLPTEAEWEYAARGGMEQDAFKYSGSSELDSVAWHNGNSNGRTHGVGQLKENGLGLYDMSGNVWDWCWDWHDGLESGVFSNPIGPKSGSGRVLRGGSWNNNNRRNYRVDNHNSPCGIMLLALQLRWIPQGRQSTQSEQQQWVPFSPALQAVVDPPGQSLQVSHCPVERAGSAVQLQIRCFPLWGAEYEVLPLRLVALLPNAVTGS